MTRPALRSVTRELVTPNFFFMSFLSMLSYLLLQAYLLNFHLSNQTISGAFSILYKSKLLFYIITGYMQSMPTLYMGITLMTSLLVGVNISLLYVSYRKARKMGAMRLTLGGSNLLAVVSSGCPSCGLTAISLLGPSTGAFSFLFQDIRLHLLILGILGFSILYSLHQLAMEPACAISKK